MGNMISMFFLFLVLDIWTSSFYFTFFFLFREYVYMCICI